MVHARRDDHLAAVALGRTLVLGVQVGVLELVAEPGQRVEEVVLDDDGELTAGHLDLLDGATDVDGTVRTVLRDDRDAATDVVGVAVVELDRVVAPVALRADAPGGGDGTHPLLLGRHDAQDELGRPRRRSGDTHVGVTLTGQRELVGGAGDLDSGVAAEEDLLLATVERRVGDAVVLGLVEELHGADHDRAGGLGGRTGRSAGHGGRGRTGRSAGGGRTAVHDGGADGELLLEGREGVQTELGARGHGSTPSGRVLKRTRWAGGNICTKDCTHVSTHYLVNRER